MRCMVMYCEQLEAGHLSIFHPLTNKPAVFKQSFIEDCVGRLTWIGPVWRG